MYTRNRFNFTRNKTLLTVVLFKYLYGIVYYFVLPQPTTIEDMYIRAMIASLTDGLLGIWALQKEGINLRSIGLQTTKLFETIVILLVGWSIFSVVLLGFLSFSGDAVTPILANSKDLLSDWMFVGTGEELLFRGYLVSSLMYAFSSFPQKRQILLALLLSNFIFATAHVPSLIYNTPQPDRVAEMLSFLPAAFVVGVSLTYFFLRTRNVLLAGLIHASINVPLIRISDDQLYLIVHVTAFLIILVIVTEAWVYFQSKQKKVISLEKEVVG